MTKCLNCRDEIPEERDDAYCSGSCKHEYRQAWAAGET